MELIFATNNRHKAEEIQQLLPESIQVLTLEDVDFQQEIPEEQDTLEGNASQKSRYIYEHLARSCFADDTGLEVDALRGAPGVYSARYAGDNKDPEANMDKLLEEMKGEENRRARFRTVISLILDEQELFFEGVVEGHILKEKRGDGGFGYDPVFMPEGSSLSFSQMPMHMKNRISHRSRAIKKLANYLNQYQNKRS